MRLHWKWAWDPLLLFLIALGIGTVWLIGPIARKRSVTMSRARVHREIGPVPVRAITKAPDTTTVRAELRAAEAAVRAKVMDADSSEADLDAAQRRVDTLRAELAALEAQRAAMRQNRESLTQTTTAGDLEAIATQRREEITRLESDLERIKASIPPPRPQNLQLTRAIEPVNKLPVLVELFENRITPVTKDYFKFPLLSLKPLFTVKRTHLGESIAQARQPNSRFAHFLSTIHPQESYVSCLLNADSFEAFYVVRQLTEKAGVEIGWEPAETSGGSISILGVRLATAKDKNRIRVPDIVSKPESQR